MSEIFYDPLIEINLNIYITWTYGFRIRKTCYNVLSNQYIITIIYFSKHQLKIKI